MSTEMYRPVSFSQMTLTELMIPAYANFGGKIHGGTLLSLMDKVAYACSSKHSGNYCVTVSVENVEFLEPVDVGDMVYMHASINYVGNTSMIVGIKVISENFKQGTVKHTNTSYFTMVAKDDSGKPVQVPGLILESRDDVRRFLEAIRRRELHRSYKTEMDKAKNALTVDQDIYKLEKERCVLNWRK